MSSVSDSASLSSPGSGSDQSGEDGSSQSMSGDRGQLGGEGRIPMETITEIREGPPEELAESNWPVKAGYGGARKDIVALERVSVVDCVCHGQEGATEKFFYMYMCHFSQLYAFWVLCRALYLQPSSHSFLYFFDTRPKSPTTWLSLISRPGINRLDAFTQSFKRFKDDFFKSEKLSVADKEMVDTLMKFNDKMPIKGLVRVYNSVHPNVDIEALRKEKATKAKAAGSTEVPNLQEPLMEVHVHGGSERKAELPARTGHKMFPLVGLDESILFGGAPCCHTYRPQPIEHVQKPCHGSHTVTPGGVPKYEHSPQCPRTTKLVSDSLRRAIHLDPSVLVTTSTLTPTHLPTRATTQGPSCSSAIPSHNSRKVILGHNPYVPGHNPWNTSKPTKEIF
ncbi:hypothetical protein DEO72_LG8g1821 [Vigna unguiculata]|uniref:Uncharacterized protein n=1 Tax=Vigna unguiculata TaxID=3917 RepID=A0A4D6MSN3_VIGUN|nr:hypothetical protein DEO72_LG8g1821 [Vigna unguiculata]